MYSFSYILVYLYIYVIRVYYCRDLRGSQEADCREWWSYFHYRVLTAREGVFISTPREKICTQLMYCDNRRAVCMRGLVTLPGEAAALSR